MSKSVDSSCKDSVLNSIHSPLYSSNSESFKPYFALHNIVVHIRYGLLINSRQPGLWSRLLAIVPVMQILPYLLMGYSFLPSEQLDAYLYTNMIWSFFVGVTMQCLVSIGGITRGTRLDIILLADGGVLPWLVGYSLSVGIVYLVSSLLSSMALGLLLRYPVHAVMMLIFALLSIPVTMSVVFFVFGLEIRFHRTFNLVSMALDVMQILSCVLFPLAALGTLVGSVARLSPVTWLNEFVRGLRPFDLLVAFVMSGALFMFSALWVHASVRRYRISGKNGG